MNADPDKPKLSLGTKSFERVNSVGKDSSSDPNDVYEILKNNKEVSDTVEKPIEITTRKSGRRRDYVVTILTGNTAAGALIWVLPKNPVVLVFGFSGMVLFSVGVTWVMWMVMDDY